MKKYSFFLIIFFLSLFQIYGESTETEKEEKEEKEEKSAMPNIFYNFGWNLLNSFAYNYGANFAVAGLGTWGMIESGLDWKWRNTMYDNEWLTTYIGGPVMTIGVIVPAFSSLVFLVSGRKLKNERMVIAATALAQTVLLTLTIQSPFKMITGRGDPGLVDNMFYNRTGKEDDLSRKFDWFNMDFINGWPSGHTANAFSAAATISEIYHDKFWVKAAAYTYAAFIGFGTTTHAHWASEAIAGALMGYAIGKTVGRSYRKFLVKDGEQIPEALPVSFYCTPYSAGVVIRL